MIEAVLCKQNAVHPRAYDYIMDERGWTYVVRGIDLHAQRVLVKALYSPAPIRQRIQNSLSGVSCAPSFSCATYGGRTTFLIPAEQIKRLIRRESVTIDDVYGAPSLVCDLADFLKETGAKVYLHGSRLLGYASTDSDWDLLVKHSTEPLSSLVDKALVFLPELRRYTPQELTLRASRYASQAVRKSQLRRLFGSTTHYLRSATLEIGLFPIRDSDSVLPLCFPKKLGARIDFLASPVPSQGSSYLMPRVIQFECPSRGRFEVQTTLWELAGIEALAGSMFRISSARPASDRIIWLGGQDLRLEVLS